MRATITSSKIQSISKPQAELSVRDTDRWRCEGGRPAIIGGKTSGGLQDPNRAEQLARSSTGQGEQKATIGTTVAVGGRHAWKNIGSFPKLPPKKLPRIHSRRISEVQPLSYQTDHPSGGVGSSINLFRQDAMHIITARDTEV